MALAGAITDRVRGLIPITWDALKNDARIGNAPLQAAIDLAKETVTGNIVDESIEGNYPHIVVDFIAKVAVIEITPMGRDYWMNQVTSISATGTNENTTYVDRAATLDSLRQELIAETRLKRAEIAKMINYWLDSGHAVPRLSTATINPYHLTPSPEEFPRPFRQTQYS